MEKKPVKIWRICNHAIDGSVRAFAESLVVDWLNERNRVRDDYRLELAVNDDTGCSVARLLRRD